MATFGDIRGALHTSKPETSWELLSKACEELEPDEQLRFDEVILPYIQTKLQSLPPHPRAAPEQWVNALLDQTNPWLERLLVLTDTIDLKNADLESKLDALLGTPYLKNIQHIDLTRAHIEDDLFARLLRAGKFGKLRTLLLESNDITEKGLKILLDSKYAEHLEVLDLGWNDLGNKGAKLLHETEHLGNLRELSIEGNSIDDEGGALVCDMPGLHKLKRLDLGWNDVATPGLERLAKMTWLDNLVRLGLENNSIPDDGVITLMKEGSMRSLVELDLYNNHLTDKSAVAIAECSSLTSLELLDLSANDMTEASRASITASKHLPPVLTLTL
jgi:Leucine-rich repeat (LRR) protein